MHATKSTQLEILEKAVKYHPGFIYIKNLNHEYLSVSNAMAHVGGFKSPEEMSGKKDSDCPWATFSEEFAKDDIHIIENKIEHYSEYILPVIYNNCTLLIKTHKIPIFNDQDEVIAILGISSSPDMNSVFNLLDGEDTTIPFFKESLNLSEIEKEIIFLLTLGKSTYQIQNFMHVRHRQISLPTINSIIRNNLFHKLNVASIDQLVKVALILKLNEIPASLLNMKKKIVELTETPINPVSSNKMFEIESLLYKLAESYNMYYQNNLSNGNVDKENLSSHIYTSFFDILMLEGYELLSKRSFNELIEIEVCGETPLKCQQQLLELILRYAGINTYKTTINYELVNTDKDFIFDIFYNNRDLVLSSIITLKDDEFIHNRKNILNALIQKNIIKEIKIIN